MLTTKGGVSFAPGFFDCEESGSCTLSAACCLNVVVTSRKITSTMSTSISATMMTAGVVRRLRTKNFMSLFARVLAADKIVAELLHFHGEDLDFFAEKTPRDERGNGDEQSDE